MKTTPPCWPPKGPDESFPCAFIYKKELVPGEVLTGPAVVTIAVRRGTDPNPASVITGPPTIEDYQVLQQLSGGLAGVTYDLECTVTTSQGNTYTRAAILPVQDPMQWGEPGSCSPMC